MGGKRYSTEQIIVKLREAEIEVGRGLKIPEMCRKLGISEQTFYRWRKRYGGRIGGSFPVVRVQQPFGARSKSRPGPKRGTQLVLASATASELSQEIHGPSDGQSWLGIPCVLATAVHAPKCGILDRRSILP